MIIQTDGRFVVRSHFLNVHPFHIVDVTLVLLLITGRPIRRLSLFYQQAILRSHPVNLLCFTSPRRLIRANRHLTHLNGWRSTASQAIRAVHGTSGSVSKFAVLLFRPYLRRIQGEDVANFVSLCGLTTDLVCHGSVVIFMGGLRSFGFVVCSL